MAGGASAAARRNAVATRVWWGMRDLRVHRVMRIADWRQQYLDVRVAVLQRESRLAARFERGAQPPSGPCR